MTLLEETTNGYGALHIDTFEVGRDYAKCNARVYGKLMLTKKGKPRVFLSEEAAIKAAAGEIRALKKQAEENRRRVLADLSAEERAAMGI